MTENIKCQKEPTLHTLSALKWMWFCSSALLKRLYSNKHVFGLWDEIREPEGKTTHGEHADCAQEGSSQQEKTFSCQATVTTTLLFGPI